MQAPTIHAAGFLVVSVGLRRRAVITPSVVLGIGPGDDPVTRVPAAIVERLEDAVGVRRVHGRRGSAVGAPTCTAITEGVLLHPLGPAALLAVLDVVARADPELVVSVCLTVPSQLTLASNRGLVRARERRETIHVSHAGVPIRVASTVATLLRLHLALLRHRTPAQWRTIDARREHVTTRETAVALGLTHQTVSKSLARADLATTDGTRAALGALLQLVGELDDQR